MSNGIEQGETVDREGAVVRKLVIRGITRTGDKFPIGGGAATVRVQFPEASGP